MTTGSIIAMADASGTEPPGETVQRRVRDAAARALAEAALRRAGERRNVPPEFDGRGGEDPVRFGDWEVNGRAVDF